MESKFKQVFFFVGELIIVGGVVTAFEYSGTFTINVTQEEYDAMNDDRIAQNLSVQDYTNQLMQGSIISVPTQAGRDKWDEQERFLIERGNQTCIKQAYLCVKQVNDNCGN